MLAILLGGSAIGTGLPAIVGRRPSVIRGRLTARAADFGLVLLQRIADRGPDVTARGFAVPCFGGAVTPVGAAVGLVVLVGLRHPPEDTAPGSATVAGTNAWRHPARGSMRTVANASWSIAAEPENIAPVRQAVVEFIVDNGIAELQLTDVRLAVSEAVTNAVMHPFREQREPGTVSVVVDVAADGHVEVVVRDGGSGMAPRDDSPGVGLGLSLIRRVTDGFDHREPAGGGTELWMSFELSAGS